MCTESLPELKKCTNRCSFKSSVKTPVSKQLEYGLKCAAVNTGLCVQLPRTELEEVGPYLLLELRRAQDAPDDLMKEALKRASTGPKKQKNVGFDEIDGKVGRMYMPKQELSELSLMKAKGTKRERQDAASDRKKQRLEKQKKSAAASEQHSDE